MNSPKEMDAERIDAGYWVRTGSAITGVTPTSTMAATTGSDRFGSRVRSHLRSAPDRSGLVSRTMILRGALPGRMMVGGKDPPVRHPSVVLLVCLGLVLASCSTVADVAETTTASTDQDPPATSTTMPGLPATLTTSTTSSAEVPASTSASSGEEFIPPQPFVAPHPTASGGGSGCSPGSGPLPDGVWFGYIDAVSVTAIDFDLACFMACDHGTGFTIRNDNPAVRNVDVREGAVVVFQNPDGEDWLESFDVFRQHEEADLHTRRWIYINDGTISHIVQAMGTRGCRSSVVDVEWMVDLPGASGVAFNDLGLLAVTNDGSGDNRFYWRSDDWTTWGSFTGNANSGDATWAVAGSEDAFAFGATVYRWTGSSWTSDTFETLGEGAHVLDMSGDRVLMAGTSGDIAEVYVLTRSGTRWTSETITLGSVDEWQTWSGTISGSTFAVADTGIDTASGRGSVQVYDFDGTSWVRTTTIPDPWPQDDWAGNWGSSIDMDGDLLVVGADGATPGPGTPGAVYAYFRTDKGWESELLGEGGEGFGSHVRIDGSTVVAGAARADPDATIWVFTVADPGWLGTPIAAPLDGDQTDWRWVWGVDVHGDLVAVATDSDLWIGRIVPVW